MGICQRLDRTFYVKFFGCRTNQFDAEALAERLSRHGYHRVKTEQEAAVILVVGCSVTHRADRDVRRYMARCAGDGGGRIVLAGCSAETDLADVADVAIPMGSRSRIEEILDGTVLKGQEGEGSRGIFFEPLYSFRGRSRIYLKIQEGCDMACAYCIVPSLRGGSRSLPRNVVLDHVRAVTERDVPELILTGTHLGGWGRDRNGEESLVDLVEEIGRTMAGRTRFRLSSIEPWDLSPALIERLAGVEGLCPSLHLPLQSGCDETLARMKRPMRTARFARLIESVRRSWPEVRIGTDLIVGFPGETDLHFAQSLDFVRSMELDYHHIFSYSARPGTRADGEAVPDAEIRRRMLMVRNMDERARRREAASRVGGIVEIVPAGDRGVDQFNHRVVVQKGAPSAWPAALLVTGSERDVLAGVVVQ